MVLLNCETWTSFGEVILNSLENYYFALFSGKFCRRRWFLFDINSYKNKQQHTKKDKQEASRPPKTSNFLPSCSVTNSPRCRFLWFLLSCIWLFFLTVKTTKKKKKKKQTISAYSTCWIRNYKYTGRLFWHFRQYKPNNQM